MATDTKVKHTPIRSNARNRRNLIAAAPELLAACKFALAQVRQDNDSRNVSGECRLTQTRLEAAIRKAEGGE